MSTDAPTGSSSLAGNGGDVAGSGGGGGGSAKPNAEIVERILKANPMCADCTTTKPDWVSINLGIVICIECSGIHRSLGTHLSKVRSLTLDTLPISQLGVLQRIGNGSSNQVWEENLPSGKKPSQGAGRAAHEKFIREKYEAKQYITPPATNGAALQDKLAAAAGSNSLPRVMWCLSHGADVNGASSCGDIPLHLAAAAGKDDCCELLLQNGANPHINSQLGVNAAVTAMRAGEDSCVAIINRFM